MTPRKDLTFSVLIPPRPAAGQGPDPTLTLAAALGIALGLESLGVRCKVKWPNDVLGTQGKMAGILAEVALRPDGRPEGSVVGIGVNLVLTPQQTTGFDPPASSLLMECGRLLSPEAALDRLLPVLDEVLERWHAHGFQPLREVWLSRCAWRGQWVILRDEVGSWTGWLRDVGLEGQLVLEMAGGCIRCFWSGDLRLADEAAFPSPRESPCPERPAP